MPGPVAVPASPLNVLAGAVGGAPARIPFPLSPTQGPQQDGNLTAYRPSIRGLAVPTTVVDVSDFPGGAVTVNFTVSTASAVLAIPRASPQQPRCLLLMRCDASSNGTLLVALGNAPSATNAWFEIPIGGIILLDTRVPQDDIYISGTASTVNAVLGYSTYPISANVTG
jgi:hypothetical protein